MAKAGRPKGSRKGLDHLIDKLAEQVGQTALDLEGEDKFGDKLDALKALTTLKSVKARGAPEPEGGGIDDFAARIWGKDRSQPRAARSVDGDDDPDYEPTETDHLDGGVAGDLDGVGGETAGADPAGERDHDRVNGGE